MASVSEHEIQDSWLYYDNGGCRFGKVLIREPVKYGKILDKVSATYRFCSSGQEKNCLR